VAAKAKHAPTAFLGRQVVPEVVNGVVMCSCGFPMGVVNYVQFPSQQRWHFYRCVDNPDHVSAALPLEKNPPRYDEDLSQ